MHPPSQPNPAFCTPVLGFQPIRGNYLSISADSRRCLRMTATFGLLPPGFIQAGLHLLGHLCALAPSLSLASLHLLATCSRSEPAI